MKLRNARNMLCIAAASAVVAMAGVPAGAPAMVVQAEETQMTALDDIMRQLYALYQNRDFVSMYTLDATDAVAAYAEMVAGSGADRYVIDLDGSTKAMMYVTPEGGYWWYFGQMENNLRQGTGTTVLLSGEYYELYTGAYNMDLPGGNGTYSIHWYANGNGYDVAGLFQGTQLNGTYQVSTAWNDEGTSYTSSLPITYTNSALTAVGGWDCDVWPDEYYTSYVFYNPSADDIWFDVDSGYNIVAVGMTPDGYSGHWWGKSDISENFSSLLAGNPAAASTPATTTPAPAPAVPETPAPAPEMTTTPTTPAFPEQPAASGTYVVQRGDNLSKIADKVYGDRKQWRKIYDANKDVVRKDYIIYANQTLVIPAQ